jgi:hypothetical protein
MKELEFNGRLFFYKSFDLTGAETHESEITHFYDTEPIVKRRKRFILFGSNVEFVTYKELFSISIDIENPNHSKKKVRSLIQKEVDFINRMEEIKRGEIV